MKNISYLIITLSLMACSSFSSIPESEQPKQQTAALSLDKLTAASVHSEIEEVEFIKSSDGIKLAFRAYLPKSAKVSAENPDAVLVFYHGGGAHSDAGYQHLGQGLQENYNIAVYQPDLRGHGESGGDRGDAPSSEQVWRDINSIINYVKKQHPDSSIFLGGHSSGAGLVVNYSSWKHRINTDGYVFVAPQLGFLAETEYEGRESSFANAKVFPFVVNSMSFGLLMGHYPAVRFNYDKNADAKLVRFNTVNMANALTPSAPEQQIRNMDSAFALFVAGNDELFDPNKVLAFGTLAKNRKNTAKIVENIEHLSILINIHKSIGEWIIKH